MARNKLLMVGTVVAVFLAIASVVAYGTAYQRPQQYQQPSDATTWGHSRGGMMGTWNRNEPRGGWGGNWYGPHCPMMGTFFGWEYNATPWSNTVVIFNYAFQPQTLTVKRGTTVTWINMDWVVHTVESGTHEEPLELFDSGPLGHMGTFSYTFNETGIYKYHCDPHPTMEGVIIVEA